MVENICEVKDIELWWSDDACESLPPPSTFRFLPGELMRLEVSQESRPRSGDGIVRRNFLHALFFFGGGEGGGVCEGVAP